MRIEAETLTTHPSVRSTSPIRRRAPLRLLVACEDALLRDALGTLEQLLTYAGDAPIQTEDVLAVLGIADAEQLVAGGID